MSRTSKTITTTLGPALVLAALVAPNAGAAYQDLRFPDARDAARTSSLAGTVSTPRQDLRSPDARDAARASTAAAPRLDLHNPDARAVANARGQERYFSSYGEPEPLTVAQSQAHSTYELPPDFRTADVREAAEGRGTFNAPGVTVVEVPQPAPSPDGGVDWADAAIGAGGATGLLAITLAGALTVRRRQLGARSRAALG
jgi:hypothetical protein